MREIRFRAWDKTEKLMMHQIFTIQFLNKEVYGVQGKNKDHFVSLDDVELMQYTGLKDRNGKEIYEGDIIREEENIIGETSYEMLGIVGKRPIEKRKKFVVHFQKSLPCGFVAILVDIYLNPPNKGEINFPFCYSHIKEKCLDSYQFSNRYREYEVIGNIYENPELLSEVS